MFAPSSAAAAPARVIISPGWRRRQGGSGGTIKHLGQRVKGAEKHWRLDGVERALQVIAAKILEDSAWDEFWKRCPLARCAQEVACASRLVGALS